MAKYLDEGDIIIAKISWYDIFLGKPKDGCNCPVALSLYRMGFEAVMVDSVVEVVKNGVMYRCDISRKGDDFILSFDKFLPVAPIEISMTVDEIHHEF